MGHTGYYTRDNIGLILLLRFLYCVDSTMLINVILIINIWVTIIELVINLGMDAVDWSSL